MSRLIDVEKLIEDIEKSRKENPHNDIKIASNHNFEHFHFIKLVNEQPTAFDVDKVVSELETRRKEYENEAYKIEVPFEHSCYLKGIMRGYEYSIDVVKAGGIYE